MEHPISLVLLRSLHLFTEMLKQPDVASFVEAMIEEVAAHEKNEHWEMIPRWEIGDAKTILSIWSFRHKQYPDDTINKHKARLCARYC